MFGVVRSILTCAIIIGLWAGSLQAADWPQWRGPNRDAVCTETGLLKQWPEGGPKLLWEISGLGPGYSTVAIKDGKLSLSIKEASDLMAKEVEEETFELPESGEEATTSLGSLFANIKLD